MCALSRLGEIHMKLLTTGAALVALAAPFAFVHSANAATGLYVAARAGQTFDATAQSFHLSDDTAFGAAVGAKVGPLRVEGGVDRISADTLPFSAHAVDYHADAFLDVPVGHVK